MDKKILVLCTGNSCRSQMAEAYLRHFAGDRAQIFSAGVEVHGLNPRAVTSMQEDGIDISHQTSNHVDEYSHLQFDYVITVCDNANERCPYFPAKAKRFHQNFPDPAKATGTEQEIALQFSQTRQLIKAYCEELITNHIINPSC